MRHGMRSWCCCSAVFLALAAWGEEYVYEGKPAAEWVKMLKAGMPADRAIDPEHMEPGALFGGMAKPLRALAALGKDALPAIMQSLKEPDPKASVAALCALKNAKLDEDGIAMVLPLLKDPSFEVRRGAVRVLGRYTRAEKIVAAAVQAALQDRDKAVVEAAEEALSKAKDDEDAVLRKRFDKFLAEAKASATNGDLEDAKLHLGLAKGLGLDDPEA
ncbi:MAG: HEAT repeat domain-containing protein, partial [Planctomycetota bacterium]